MAKSIAQKILDKKSIPMFEKVEEFLDDSNNEYLRNDDDQTENFPGLINAIYDCYLIDQVDKPGKKDTFSPSKLVYGEGTCPRFWYLSFKDGRFINKYDSGKNVAVMQNGTGAHDRIQKALQRGGIQVSSEDWVRNEDPPIKGRLDSILQWDEKEFLAEIKTCSEDAFERHKRTNTATGYHVLQLLIYMKILKKKNGIILYENKNTQDLLAIPLNITQKHVDFIEYMFDWMREVYAAIQEDKLPEVPFRSNDIKICQKCSLQEVCKEYPKGDIKIARRKDEKGAF